MNTSTHKPSTFVNLRKDGSYDYGYCVRVGKRDRLDVIGTQDEYEAAQKLALSLPHRTAAQAQS